ncbi:uncharacterized protein LOC135833920 [Planococcus citri]|uniref:uncharacterized protein LOC135833920 n=1 Tax=Planococcus citri TaxID=170843 RepID=UPI0031F8BDA5
MKDLIFYFFLLCNIFEFGSAIRIGDILKVCHQKDPKLNKCIKENLESLRPFLKTGIPELSIPSFTELHIPEIVISQYTSFFIGYVEIKFSNLHLTGLDGFQIADLKADLDNNELYLKLWYLRLNSKSTFRYSKTIVINFNGGGSTEGDYADIGGTIHIKGTRNHTNEDGNTYFYIHSAQLSLDFSQTTGTFKNALDPSSDVKGKAEEFVVTHWKDVMENMKPTLEKHTSEVITQLFQAIFKQIPLEVFLPS